jgi:FMN-dependent NADH-azoreductase
MSTLLKIDVSSRGDRSMQQVHPDGKVIKRDIATTNLPFVEFPWITANITKVSARTEAQKTLLKLSDDLIAELQQADEYLIATPMYNYGIPAKLKAYVDHVVRAGLTFKMNADGSYAGLLSDKKATVIIASAGEYSPGAPAEGMDTLKPYLREILGYIGVTDVAFIQSGSTWKVDIGSEEADAHIEPLKAQVKLAAGP